MNTAHLRAFLWLRWRLALNQIERSGTGGAIVAALFSTFLVLGSVFGLVGGFVAGYVGLAGAPPHAFMLAWDAAIAGYLMFWLIGLISELHQSDAIALDRLLHLPVSPRGAFVINYLGSSVSLSLAVMLPVMTGLATGLVLSHGPRQLLLFPLVTSFFVMMTAVTHQFRGWLASLLANPRRRRAVLAALPIIFILVVQLPNLWHITGLGVSGGRGTAGLLSGEEGSRDVARTINLIVPPGWLAYGAVTAFEGQTLPAIAATLGMALIGTLSLGRAYRTSLQLYTGAFTTKSRGTSPRSAVRRRADLRGGLLVERRLPGIPDGVAGMALAGFQSWLRAPEMKMALLTPVLMLLLFTGMNRALDADLPGLVRPLRTSGLVGFLLLMGMLGPIGNQFAYDRAGFRAFVIGPAPRGDILFAKNLAHLPFAALTIGLAIGLSQWFRPLPVGHLLGVVLQSASMYVVFCLCGNLLSILGPIALKPGSGSPARHQGLRMLYPLVFVMLVPIPLALTALPLGLEALFARFGWLSWLSVYPIAAAVQVALILQIYRRVIHRQGALLQRREQKVLEVVAART